MNRLGVNTRPRGRCMAPCGCNDSVLFGQQHREQHRCIGPGDHSTNVTHDFIAPCQRALPEVPAWYDPPFAVRHLAAAVAG